MTGLDKIINQIEAEATLLENQILEEARKTTGKILAEAKQEGKELESAIAEKSKVDIRNYRERIKSSSDFQSRTELLKAKQEMITEVIEKAYHSIENDSADAYFAFIEKMIKKFALDKEGEIYFSKKDLSRLPADFEEVIKKAAALNGGSLTLIREAKDIENGFVLVYGGIEENCTLRAVFDAKKEHMKDKTHAVLFF